MPLYRPNELKAFLEEIGAAPRRSLSQNFLIDGNVIQKTVTEAEVIPGDCVLEIGPGPGVLTEALLNAGAHVVAIEKDRRFAKALNRLQTEDKRLTVIEGDALTLSIETIKEMLKKHPAKLIANLPYSITTPLLTRFAPLSDVFDRLVVCVQDEVAVRLTASPGPSIGSITHFLTYYGKPGYAFRIKKNCFFPAPKVDSAVFTLLLKKRSDEIKEETFFELVRTGFGQRRKMLRNNLSKWGSDRVIQALKSLNLKETSRAEELSFDQWLKLHKELSL